MQDINIPEELEAFDAEWFTNALNKHVKSINLISKHFSTTGHARINLFGDPTLPKSIFLKFAPMDEAQRKFVSALGMGVREARFYRELANEMPVRIPKVFFANSVEDRYVIVLEDLVEKGCRFPSARDTDIIERVYPLIEQMSQFHGLFWESSRFYLDGDLAWIAEHSTGIADGGASYIQMAYDKLKSNFSEDFSKIATYYIDNAPAIIKLINKGPRTLNQGDAGIKNMFIDVNADNRPGFLDWGVINASPGIIDVSYAITNALPTDLRAKHEKDLIKTYCNGLSKVGVHYDQNLAWESYKLSVIYCWVAATATAAVGSRWLAPALSMYATERATEACVSLGTLEIIKSLC